MKTRQKALKERNRVLKSVAIFAVAIFWMLSSSKQVEAATVETISISLCNNGEICMGKGIYGRTGNSWHKIK